MYTNIKCGWLGMVCLKRLGLGLKEEVAVLMLASPKGGHGWDVLEIGRKKE